MSGGNGKASCYESWRGCPTTTLAYDSAARIQVVERDQSAHLSRLEAVAELNLDHSKTLGAEVARLAKVVAELHTEVVRLTRATARRAKR